jgi:hypothetical protein
MNPGWEMDEKMHIEYQTICKELYKNIESDDKRKNKKSERPTKANVAIFIHF